MTLQERFAVGQRWLSEAEPELGLGIVIETAERRVTVAFHAVDTVRQYAARTAPLRRVRFRPGDRVTARDGRRLTVDRLSESGGCLVYHDGEDRLAEADLSDRTGFNAPLDRLLTGRTDTVKRFDLRCRALFARSRWRRSPVHGFCGGRVELVPHQFHIAREVAGRRAPRVLLCDETGLGKTIEAGLILHRLLVTGRIARVLILVPESLVHQWFVELYRRFNLAFRICDQALQHSLTRTDPQANPFAEDPLVLASVDYAAATFQLAAQTAAADWDLVIVDEAHHLRVPGPAYDLVADLAHRSPGLLLLTATPEQLGQASHFARLRLLDPDRHRNFETFVQEAAGYQRVAALAGRILDGRPLNASQRKQLRTTLAPDPALADADGFDAALADNAARRRIIDDLIDRHGIGRVVFRNTRRTVQGFPQRRVHLIPLPGADARTLTGLAEAFAAETAGRMPRPADFSTDPRLDWLARFLRDHENEKLLLICRSVQKAEAVSEALARRINVESALFHEGLSLIHRDRNAAWFADPDGARILICSEIGSEGRNFQFAGHLVLFDLPLDPEQLEQRIGRLDRIGRTAPVDIHVPYLRGSAQEVLAVWFHHGLNAFERVLSGGRQVLDRFGKRVIRLATAEPDRREDLTQLIDDSGAFVQDLRHRLNRGRDRLLEIGSHRPRRAARTVARIADADTDGQLGELMTELFAHAGIEAEAVSPTLIRLRPGLGFDDDFPGFLGEEMVATFDRRTALTLEHALFLTRDHPMVTEAMERLIGTEQGNCALAWWPARDEPTLYLEAVYVLECVAPPALHLDRFLPATPFRVVVDHQGNEVSDPVRAEIAGESLGDAPRAFVDAASNLLRQRVPPLLNRCQTLVEARARETVDRSRQAMNETMNREIHRLKALARINAAVRMKEIVLAEGEQRDLDREIARARLRLDALRLIWQGPLPRGAS